MHWLAGEIRMMTGRLELMELRASEQRRHLPPAGSGWGDRAAAPPPAPAARGPWVPGSAEDDADDAVAADVVRRSAIKRLSRALQVMKAKMSDTARRINRWSFESGTAIFLKKEVEHMEEEIMDALIREYDDGLTEDLAEIPEDDQLGTLKQDMMLLRDRFDNLCLKG